MRISDEQVAYLEKLYSSDANYEEWKKHYDGRRGSQIADILADLREARKQARSERRLWALLLEADATAETEFKYAESARQGLRASEIGISIRRELRDRFGLNLDNLCTEAREEFMRRLSTAT